MVTQAARRRQGRSLALWPAKKVGACAALSMAEAVTRPQCALHPVRSDCGSAGLQRQGMGGAEVRQWIGNVRGGSRHLPSSRCGEMEQWQGSGMARARIGQGQRGENETQRLRDE